MPFIPTPGDLGWRTHIFPKFVGGISSAPKTDAECMVLNNFEILQDGITQCRKGLVQATALGTLGTGLAAGMAYDGVNTLFVAKEGSTIYALNGVHNPPPWTATSFDSVGTIDKGYPVWFTFQNTETSNYVFYSAGNWPVAYSWDYMSGPATQLTTFPANVQYLVWHNGYLYALLQNGELHWSDTSDPFTWPTTNCLVLSTAHGKAIAIKSLQDRLVIFCTNGILYMTGDPSTSPYIGLLISDLPVDTPMLLGVQGSTAVFSSGENMVQLADSANILTNSVVGITEEFQTDDQESWLAVSPDYVVVRSVDEGNTGDSNAGVAELWVRERIRYGTWCRWEYNI